MIDTNIEELEPDSEGDVTFKLLVGDVEAPIIELSPCPLPSSPLQSVKLDPSVLAQVEALIRAAPGMIATGLHASSTNYILKFAPDVTAQLQAGTLTLMPAVNGGVRAIAVDRSGRIIGHGKLIVSRGLSTVATAALLWQTLALVTAQHYLQDIQHQLREISAGIKDIHDLLIAKEFALLVSHERYLQRIVNLIQQGSARELDMAAVSIQLEHMERECDQVQELMRQLMERQRPRLVEAPLTAWFPWEVQSNVAAAQKYVDEFDRAAQGFAATVRVKAMLAAVRSQIFFQTQTGLKRLQEAMEDSRRGRSLVVAFYELIDKRGVDVWANTDLPGFLKGFRQDLAQRVAERRFGHRMRFDQLDASLQRGNGHLINLQLHAPPGLILQVHESGKIDAYKAPQEADIQK